MSWNQVDWDQRRPSSDEVGRALAQLRLEDVSTAVPADAEIYLSRLRELYTNGGALAVSCRMSDDPCLAWFVSRNRVDECRLLNRALELLSGSEIHPELLESRYDVEYEELSPLLLGGYLACTLVDGGAYENMERNLSDAKRLGESAATALIEERYGDFLVYRSYKPWSSWFCGIAWDYSWFLLDKAERRLAVLCATDTD